MGGFCSFTEVGADVQTVDTMTKHKKDKNRQLIEKCCLGKTHNAKKPGPHLYTKSMLFYEPFHTVSLLPSSTQTLLLPNQYSQKEMEASGSLLDKDRLPSPSVLTILDDYTMHSYFPPPLPPMLCPSLLHVLCVFAVFSGLKIPRILSSCSGNENMCSHLNVRKVNTVH